MKGKIIEVLPSQVVPLIGKKILKKYEPVWRSFRGSSMRLKFWVRPHTHTAARAVLQFQY